MIMYQYMQNKWQHTNKQGYISKQQLTKLATRRTDHAQLYTARIKWNGETTYTSYSTIYCCVCIVYSANVYQALHHISYLYLASDLVKAHAKS